MAGGKTHSPRSAVRDDMNRIEILPVRKSRCDLFGNRTLCVQHDRLDPTPQSAEDCCEIGNSGIDEEDFGIDGHNGLRCWPIWAD